MFSKLVSALVVLVLLIGVPIVAEASAGHRLSASVRTAVHGLAPGARVDSVEPHGRPFVAALLGDEVSSAYVHISGAGGKTMLILKRLHRDTGRVNAVLWFRDVPEPIALRPVKRAGGAYTDMGRGRLDGSPVTVRYGATVEGATVAIRPLRVTVEGQTLRGAAIPTRWRTALTPRPVRLAAVGRLRLNAVSVGEDGITAELRQRDVRTRGVRGGA